jgi:glycine/D-amino acid oxidase-like deaminating enzyme
VEPVGPGHAHSGSGDRSRIVRALYDDPGFTRSGHESLALWSAYEAELGERFFERTGVLYFDRQGADPGTTRFRGFLDLGLANLRALGVRAEEVAPDEIRKRWPAVATGDLLRAVLEPDGGFVRPSLASRTIARAALGTGRVTQVAGACRRVVVEGGRACGVDVAVGGDVEPRDAEEILTRIAVDAVVVAAARAGVELVRPFLSGDLDVRRVPHFATYWDVPYPAAAGLHMSALPTWADLGRDLYGMPDDGDAGFKIAWHAPRRLASPDESPMPDARELEELREAAAVRFPSLRKASLRSVYGCAYDSTPDERFEIGEVPGVRDLVLVTGLSGHGFKHAPALGESIADLVLGEPPRLDLSGYALRIRPSA